MFFLLFNLLTISEIVFDYKIKKRISPFLLITIPYLAIIDLNNLILTQVYDFYAVSDFALFRIAVFISIIFLIEIFVYNFFPDIKTKERYAIFEKNNSSIIFVLFYIGLAAYVIIFVLRVKSLGLRNIKGTSNGPLGHLSFLFFILVPAYFYKMLKIGKQIIALFFIACGLIVSVLFGGKYVIFINATYWFICYVFLTRLPKKRLLKLTCLFIIFGVLVFIAIYAIIPVFSKGEDAQFLSRLKFSVEHFFSYLCYPVISNNYAMGHINADSYLIPHTVVINIFKALIGDKNYVSPLNEFVFPVTAGNKTNVAGLFGELHYCLGDFSFLYVFLLFVIIEVFWYYSEYSRKYFLTRCYLGGIMSFLFFCNFFTVSGVVLPLIYVFVIELILQKVGKYARR